MIKDIVVPPHIPEEAAESYREFVLAQMIQALLNKHGVGRFQAAIILGYVTARTLQQLEHPAAAQGSAQQFSDIFQQRMMNHIQGLLARPDIQVRMNAMNPIAQRMDIKAAVRAPVDLNITEAEFRAPAPGEAPSPIVLQ